MAMKANKKYILWGTGMGATRFIEEMPEINFAYVVDGNPQKWGSEFHGYVVTPPDEIRDWHGYTVVIASIRYYDEIAQRLVERGLEEHRDFLSFQNLPDFYSRQELIEQVRIFLEDIKKIADDGKPKRLIVGLIEGSPHVLHYFDSVAKIDTGHEWVYFSERTMVDKVEMDYIQTFSMPCIFQQFTTKENVSDKEEFSCEVDGRIHAVAIAMKRYYEVCTIEYADFVCKSAYDFFSRMISMLKPDKAYLWAKTSILHTLFKMAADDAGGVELRYLENGGLPGTIEVEKMGHLGESWPAIRPGEFQRIPVTRAEKEHAREVIAFLYDSEINRYEQPDCAGLMADLGNELDPERPTILFAGQAKTCGKAYKGGEHGMEAIPPVFDFPEDAVRFVRALASENGWNVIYKAHPLVPTKMQSDGEGFICVNGGNIHRLIDICDLVIAMESTVGYIALIRNKPLLMLGYMQLLHKGCAYEAFDKGIICETIKLALEQGYTKEMREAFVEHVARLDKAYLYDDMTGKPVRIGKCLGQFLLDEGI